MLEDFDLTINHRSFASYKLVCIKKQSPEGVLLKNWFLKIS